MFICGRLILIKPVRLIKICCATVVVSIIVFYAIFWEPYCFFAKPLYSSSISSLALAKIYTYGPPRSSSHSKNLIIILVPKISSKLTQRLQLIDRNFADNFSTNLLILYSNVPYESDLLHLTDAIKRPVSFLNVGIFFNLFPIRFDPCKTKTPYRYRGKWNYSLMIRFWFKFLFELPELEKFEYVMRLDDDSKLTDKWMNVFDEMRNKNAVYFANNIDLDLEEQLPGTMFLKQVTFDYIKQNNIKPKQFEILRDAFGNNSIHTYFNNFEVLKMEFFRRKEIRHWVESIDSTNGIFYYRWGDAGLRYLTLALFAEQHEVLHRADYNLSYCHKCR
ncbi:unnamed protein product [Rotaria sp. Silwood1]|nr:unnamed protein product [Rotaria sp. Silwood1]